MLTLVIVPNSLKPDAKSFLSTEPVDKYVDESCKQSVKARYY